MHEVCQSEFYVFLISFMYNIIYCPYLPQHFAIVVNFSKFIICIFSYFSHVHMFSLAHASNIPTYNRNLAFQRTLQQLNCSLSMLLLMCSYSNSFVCFGWYQSPAASDSGSTGTNSQGSSSLRETPPVTLPHEVGNSTAAPNNVVPSLSSSVSRMTTLQSVTSMAASLAAVAALSSNISHSGSGPVTNIPGVPTPPGAMPFYPPPPHHGGLFPHWYLSPPHSHLSGRTVPSPTVSLADGLRLEAVPSVKQDPSTTPPIVMALPPSSSTSEQPLDLSAKAVACVSESARDCSPVTTSLDEQQSLKVPNIDSKHIFK